MNDFEKQLKPFLEPLITRIEALQAENKELKTLHSNSKHHDKNHIKNRETHQKKISHAMKSQLADYDKLKEKEKEEEKLENKDCEDVKKEEIKVSSSNVHTKTPKVFKEDLNKDKVKSSHKQTKTKETLVKSHQSPGLNKNKKNDKIQNKEEKKQNVVNNHIDHNVNPQEKNEKHHLVRSKQNTNLVKEKYTNVENKKQPNLQECNKDFNKDVKGEKHDLKHSNVNSKLKNKVPESKNQKQDLNKLHYKNLGDDLILHHDHHPKLPNLPNVHENHQLPKEELHHHPLHNEKIDTKLANSIY